MILRPSSMLLATAALGVLVLSACSSGEGGSTAASSDPYAGFDAQIPAWRTEVENTHEACAVKNNGKGCEAFEVTCKGAKDLTAEDTAKGVTARVVAAMRFSSTSADGSTGKPATAYADFAKAGETWTRTVADPVSPTTCAPL